ncbi:MAG TPA: hypothetical protein VKB54_08455 [Solirubrobacteraceae bacterium]|jgi:hypothetical protein|nr:hypothetical protein [Solirubrobacteraceae bacterium]
MGLFKRKKESGSMCPRCSQLVSDDEGLVCPMCGWDLRDAYQGPTVAAVGAGHNGEKNSDAA